MRTLERWFEGFQWNSRFVVLVEVVDGYLLATVMLIFSLGLYELFVSDIDAARNSKAPSRILVIESLDDLKNRLAKWILMILIVKLFEHALRIGLSGPLELRYLGGSIALAELALYLSHAADTPRKRKSRAVSTEGGGNFLAVARSS
ncbi:MAG: YqhA family protein [Betaproteobacteria bacterium]|nr:YqhA family protein [Betaproteobacteria bacterium]